MTIPALEAAKRMRELGFDERDRLIAEGENVVDARERFRGKLRALPS